MNDLLRALMYIILLIVFLFVATPSKASDDKVADYLEYGSYAAVLADWAQTLQIREKDGVYEQNDWLFGKQPTRRRVNTVMSLEMLSVWYINRHLPNKSRRLFNGVFLTTRLYVVNNNLKLGLKVKF